MSKVEGNGASNWEAVKGVSEGVKAVGEKAVDIATSPIKQSFDIADKALVHIKDGSAKILDGAFDELKKLNVDPKQLVDEVLNPPKGTTQARALLDFEEKLTSLSDKQLSELKGYAEGLSKNESDPKTQELLSELLKSVAQEEKSRFFKPKIEPTFPIYKDPNPIIPLIKVDF